MDEELLIELVYKLAGSLDRLSAALDRLDSAEQSRGCEGREGVNRHEEGADSYCERLRWAEEHGLSDARALKAWARSGLPIERTTPERLIGFRNCGDKTREKVAEWVKSFHQPTSVWQSAQQKQESE